MLRLDVQPLFADQGSSRHPRLVPREARPHGQSAFVPRRLPRPDGPDRAHRRRQRAEPVMARWGMPGPPQYGGAPVTNIRNVSSPHWRGWLGKRNRCLVPATSFCEHADTKPRKTPIWFTLAEDRPLFAFAGLWASWRGVRGPKSAPVEGQNELFASSPPRPTRSSLLLTRRPCLSS
jgi:putative SOS response-associated peptidase YedK